jgi:hypothetical protein
MVEVGLGMYKREAYEGVKLSGDVLEVQESEAGS